MRTYRQIKSGFAISVGAMILAFQILGSAPAYADHDVQHDVKNMKGGLVAIEQRVWENEQRLCDLYQVLSIHGLIQDFTLPDSCTVAALLAVAYINDDEVAGYSETADTLIAGLYDANNDSVPSVGDQIRYGNYPRDFEGTQRGTFFQTINTVVEVKAATANTIQVSVDNDDILAWENEVGRQSYFCDARGGDDERVLFVDLMAPSTGNDSIDVDATELLGQCGTPSVEVTPTMFTLDTLDNNFLDVDIFFQ